MNIVQFTDDFYSKLPHKPRCCDDFDFGTVIRHKKIAIKKRHIQYNPPCLIYYLIFDQDHAQGAMAWHDAGLPRPTWTAQNPENGHAHICYELAIPVCTSDAARQKPLQFLAALQAAFCEKLGADKNFTGLITKNPVHPSWRVVRWTDEKYEMSYLADFVTLPTKKIEKPDPAVAAGLGRNCMLFEIGRKWAYKAIKDFYHLPHSHEWERAVYEQISAINSMFPVPLPYSEVKATARSISRWVWRRFSHSDFCKFQSRSAKFGVRKGNVSKGGKARSQQYSDMRQEALKLHILGFNPTQIAKKLGISRPSVYKWVKNCPKV